MSTGRELLEAGMGIATSAVALHLAASQAMGLHPSEGLCLWQVIESAYGHPGTPVTAGRLAEVTGLTTGAITGIIDRLEASGLVTRERDEADRRKVLIRPVPEGVAAIYGLFQPVEEAFAELAGKYGPDEMTVILDYLTRMSHITKTQTRRLRGRRIPARGSSD
jgi:DNA-binding MarR family transcriptional regulator